MAGYIVTTGGGTSLIFPIGCEGTGKGIPPEAIVDEGTTIDDDDLDVGYGELDGVIELRTVVDVPAVTPASLALMSALDTAELTSLTTPEAVAVDPASEEMADSAIEETELTACRALSFGFTGEADAEDRPKARRGKSL